MNSIKKLAVFFLIHSIIILKQGMCKSNCVQSVGNLAYTFAHAVAVVLTPFSRCLDMHLHEYASRCLIVAASQALPSICMAISLNEAKGVMTTSQHNQGCNTVREAGSQLTPCVARCGEQIFAYVTINCSHSHWL